MKGFLDALIHHLFEGAEGLGVLAALLLVAALNLALPADKRRLARTPLLLIAAHLLVFSIDLLVPASASVDRFLGPLAALLLFASLARSLVLLALDVIVARRSAQPFPRIIREIVQGLAYAFALLSALHAAGVEPGSLLTTSALLTAVIGLSLQETLGNMFAGLAIQMQRPFDVGDWIQFDGELRNIGRVVEINWRATKVITLDEVEIIVPNASLAKAPIKNFTKPSAVSRRSIFVNAPYEVPPLEVKRAILEAIGDAPGVVAEPQPSVVTNVFGEYGIEYWVRYYTDQFHRRDAVDSGVRDRVWYALRRARVEIPYPHRTLELHQVTEETSARKDERQISARERALRCVDIFRVLSAEERRGVAQLSAQRLYAPGEVIVRQGDAGSELYVIERGDVLVSVHRAQPKAGESVEVARLGAGKFFGEMALVTGDPRQATVRAMTECELLVVGREAMEPLMKAAPDLAERISAVLAERQAELGERAATLEGKGEREAQVKKDLLDRIRKFFEV
jgi:small-conductance mechanosensitive channel/CRP-like cAMP-binding protein